MMRLLGLCLWLCLALGKEESGEPKLWALLVAGSNGYYNYRHQVSPRLPRPADDRAGGCLEADVCHAYQILHRHGIPDENIVVMLFDDIAESKELLPPPFLSLRLPP